MAGRQGYNAKPGEKGFQRTGAANAPTPATLPQPTTPPKVAVGTQPATLDRVNPENLSACKRPDVCGVEQHVKGSHDEEKCLLETGHMYEFNSVHVEKAKKRIDTANRKLARAGVEQQFTYETREVWRDKRDENTGEMYKEQVTQLVLNKPSIKKDGYTFLAKLDETESGILVKSMPGVEFNGEAPEDMLCQHCGKVRHRKNTYLIRQPDGTVIQVGSACLRPFLGISPSGLATLDADLMARGDDDDWYLDPVGERGESTEYALAVALAVSDNGKQYQRSDSESPTKEKVGMVLSPPSHMTFEGQEYVDSVRAEAVEHIKSGRVKEIVNLMKDVGQKSDWARNLTVLANNEHVTFSNLGLLSSAVLLGKPKQDPNTPAAYAKGYIADVGEKVKGKEMVVEKVFHRDMYDHYSGREVTRTQIVFRDDENHQGIWWASSYQDYEPGVRVQATSGTVKKHDTYNDVDQTVFTRLKIVPVDVS